MSQGEKDSEVIHEKEPEEKIMQEENQKEQLKSTYQLRNRATIQAPQRFTYLCQRTPVEPNSYNEALQVRKERTG